MIVLIVRRPMLNEPRRGGQSTGRRWSAKHGTPAKCIVGQQPRRGGRMTTTYTSYHCSATPSGLLISNHHQAGVTLRSTTCLWSSQPFGLHFTISCHTRQVQILQVGCSFYNLFFPMVQGIKKMIIRIFPITPRRGNKPPAQGNALGNWEGGNRPVGA